ncbi:MAG: CotH kinase family protein [Bdellovibrionota bacterium]
MNTKILAEQGYDLSRLKTNKTRLRFKKLLRWLFVLVLIILLSKFVLDYIAGFPRERFAKDFGYWKRVWLGGKKAIYGTYLELVAPHDDPKASKLKVVDLFIKGQALDKLKSNLPESGSLYQSADFRIEDKIYQASARFRGDSINHWAFPQKSWRVRFKKGKDYEGMPLLNLTVPRVETQFANWLGYELGNRIGGLLVPRAELVHFRLNRKFDGVRMLLEQPDQDFLINRNLATGKIYNGDIDSSQIYGNVPRKPLYKDYSAWKLDVPGDEESPYPAEMIKLVKLIKDSDNPYEFFYSFRDLMDVQALASYMALLEIVGSVHVDETHNGKFYFNPSSGKFQPIVWDTVAYLWKNQKAIDLGSNSLFRKALSIPEIRELKDQVLWNSLNGNLSTTQLQKLIDKQADTVRSDVYAFAHKIHANDKGIRYVSNPEWEAAVEELKTIVQERNQDIIAKLLANDSVYRLKSEDSTHKLLGIEVRSLAGLLVDQLTLQTPGLVDGTKLVVRRLGLADLLYPEKDRRFESFAEVKNGKVEIRLEDKLYSKRKFKNKKTGSVVPAKYVYQIILPKPSEVSIINISAKNSITKADYTPVEDPNLELGSVQKANIVWWNPDDNLITKDKILSGNIEVKEDLILDKYTNLIIKAGTNLKVHPGVSIIAKGANVEIQGTKSAPVTIQAFNKAKKWGVFAVNGSQNVKLKDLVVSDGSYAYHDFVNYTGAISIHNSKAYVENSQLNGSYLSVQNSDLEIKNSQISNTYPFDLRSENSVVQKIAVVHQQIKPVLNADIMQGDAYGTPSRIEREHKYSILDHTNEVSLDQLAEEIRVALSSSMEEAGLWKVPDMINSKLYADTSTGDFAFRDIYFDTADGLAYKHALSYRYRNRFGSLGSHKRHLKKPNAT